MHNTMKTIKKDFNSKEMNKEASFVANFTKGVTTRNVVGILLMLMTFGNIAFAMVPKEEQDIVTVTFTGVNVVDQYDTESYTVTVTDDQGTVLSPSSYTTVYHVNGGTKSNESSNGVTVYWTALGTGNYIRADVTYDGLTYYPDVFVNVSAPLTVGQLVASTATTVCDVPPGNPGPINISGGVSGGDGSYTYIWETYGEITGEPDPLWYNTGAASTNSFDPVNVEDQEMFRLTVLSGNESVTTNTITYTFLALDAPKFPLGASREGPGPVTITVDGGVGVPTDYTWYTQAVGGTAISGETSSVLAITNQAYSQAYWVTKTNGSCESMRIRINVSVVPDVVFQNDISLIETTGSVTMIADPGYSTYSWTDDEGTEVGTAATLTTTTAGDYTVTVDNQGIITARTVRVIGFNQIVLKGFDENENIIAHSSTYFDQTGKLVQSQSWDRQNNEVFVSEPLYDRYGRAVGGTMSAPVGQTEIGYKEGFNTVNGEAYDWKDFDDTNTLNNPTPPDNTTSGTLGYYYSNNNTEPYVATTAYPYSRTDFYEDGTGEAKNSAGPGNQHRMGAGHESLQKTLPVLDGELPHYNQLRDLILELPAASTNTDRLIKRVSHNPDGREAIVYQDESGNTLASMLPGGNTTQALSLNDDQKAAIVSEFDFFVPEGQANVNVSIAAPENFAVVDKLTNNVISGTGGSNSVSTSLDPGVYAVVFDALTSPTTLDYSLNYSDHAYSFYDDAGRLVAAITSKGMEEVLTNGVPGTKAGLTYTTFYTYDFRGRLVEMQEPDAGITKYSYRNDGQIRFSQNEEQLSRGTSIFSYTNYDQLGRPVESGECNCEFDFGSTQANNHATDLNLQNTVGASSTTIDWIKTYYDTPQLPDLSAQGSLSALSQQFVQGAVSSTESEEVQSWYSYDDLGRVTWFLQHLKTLDKYFLIEYEYDFLGNVLSVGFQPQTLGNAVSEAFWHHYQYDQNQRLSKVYTAITDSDQIADWYLHAAYEYYEHGPIKRVVLAEDLQGIDYTYTVQGWLKGINHPIKGLDPGQDGVLDANGDGKADVSEDAFGMTLEYFEEDYATGASTSFNPLQLDENTAPQQFSGNIRSVVFPGAENGEYQVNGQPDDVEVSQYDPKQVNLLGKESVTLQPGFNTNGGRLSVGIGAYDLNTANNVEAYAYDYDQKYQLTNAKFGKSTDLVNDPNNVDNAYDVSINGYDANGNIQGIDRYADDPSTLENDFDFEYYPGTNKLKSVTGYLTLMEYNKIGQLVKQVFEDASERYIAYNVSGKVTAVYSDAAMQNALIEFAYDDRGFRVMKRVGNVENWYVRDAPGQVMATYNKQIPGTAIAQIELPIYGASKLGMAFKNPDHYKYIYELTDHLGSVRALVTKLALQSTASMEIGEDARESQFFDNLGAPVRQQDMNRSKSGTYFASTNPTHPVGPTTTLRVKAGDVIDLEAFAKYVVPGGFNNALLTSGAEGLLGGGVNDAAVGVEGGGLSTAVVGELSTLMGAATANSGQPKAYLQFILFDDNFAEAGSDQVMTDSNFDPDHENFERLTLTANATVDGYLYAYVVNESTLDIDFDDFTFIQTGIRVIRQTDYYPFGAVAKVWNNPDQTQQEKYRHGYQGEYSEMDSTTGWNAFQLRMYDPLIGRWLQMDPERQFASPYNGMGNNPLSGTDPTGGYCPKCPDPSGDSDFWSGGQTYTPQGSDAIYELVDPSMGRDGWVRTSGSDLAQVTITPSFGDRFSNLGYDAWNSQFSRWLIGDAVYYSVDFDFFVGMGIDAKPIGIVIPLRGEDLGSVALFQDIGLGGGLDSSIGLAGGRLKYSGHHDDFVLDMFNGMRDEVNVSASLVLDLGFSYSNANLGNGETLKGVGGSFGVGFSPIIYGGNVNVGKTEVFKVYRLFH